LTILKKDENTEICFGLLQFKIDMFLALLWRNFGLRLKDCSVFFSTSALAIKKTVEKKDTFIRFSAF